MTRRRERRLYGRPYGGKRRPHHYPGWNTDVGRTDGGPHGSLHASSLHASAASVEGRVHEQTPAGAEEGFWGPRDAPPSSANHRDQLYMGQMYRQSVAESMGRHGLLHADFWVADPTGTAWELAPSGALPVTLPFTHGQPQVPFPSAAMHEYRLHGAFSQHQPPSYQCSRREDCGLPADELRYRFSEYRSPMDGKPQHHGWRGDDRRHRSPAAPESCPPPLMDVVTDRHPAPSAPRSGSQGPASGWQYDPGAGRNPALSAGRAPRVLKGGREGRIAPRTESRATGARGSRAGADRGSRTDSSGVQSRDSAASSARRGSSDKAGKAGKPRAGEEAGKPRAGEKAGKPRAGEGRSAAKSVAPVTSDCTKDAGSGADAGQWRTQANTSEHKR